MSEVASKELEQQNTESRSGVADASSEMELIRRCLEGQTEAFSVLVVRYQDRIYNSIYRMCRDHQESEELAQEAFLKAFEKLERFRGNSRFYTWLFRIAMNLTLSRGRRKAKVKFVTLDAGGRDGGWQSGELEKSYIPEGREKRPDEVAEDSETAQRISEAIERLDDEYRAVVVLRDIEDMDYAEISEVLEIPPGTVKSRLHRARKILQEQLADLIGIDT